MELNEQNILSLSALQLADKIRTREWQAVDVMSLTIDMATKVNEKTNALTEIFPEEALQEAKFLDDQLSRGVEFSKEAYPFLGVPFPVKDMMDLKGHPTVAGFQNRKGHVADKDATLVASTRKLGAIPFCKTNVPQFGLSLETSNTVNGATKNPYNPLYTPGGSGGGCAALMGGGGCLMTLGSDIAGSLRCPASYCGTYTFKSTPRRIPLTGHVAPLAGQESIAGVLGNSARRMEDVEALFRAVSKQELWKEDAWVLPIPHKKVDLSGKKLRIGYFVTDGKFPASPANERAVMETVNKLKRAGHDVFPFEFPDADKVFGIESKLLFADGYDNLYKMMASGEGLDQMTWPVVTMMRLPNLVKQPVCWVLEKVFGQKFLADYIQVGTPPSVGELWRWQGEMIGLQQKALEAWEEMTVDGHEMDAVISPVTALPNNRLNQFYKIFPTYWFCMIYNLLGYPAGVIPCTKVDPKKDKMELNDWLAKNVKNEDDEGTWNQYVTYSEYDAEAMKGLPVGLQIAGKKLQDEHTLEVMRIVDEIINH